MTTLLDALYSCAMERGDPIHWLREDGTLREYRMSAHMAEKNREALEAKLKEPEAELFQRYVEGRDVQELFWEQALFREGLSLGLYLGSLPRHR